MSYRTKENLKIVGIILALIATVFGCIFGLGSLMSKDTYESYYSRTISAEVWSPGTLEDAKRVVTDVIAKATKPGQIELSVFGTLRSALFDSDLPGSFDNDEVVYSKCRMLLSQKDFAAYQKWLKEISKPYRDHKKQLTPPLMPPPWNVLGDN